MTTMYILDGHEPRQVTDTKAWAKWFENHAARRVLLSTIPSAKATVSTIFLGFDHGIGPHGPQPVLFETAVRRPLGAWDVCSRYATWDEAVAGHAHIVAELERAA